MLLGMGVTNLTFTLTKRYAGLSGQILKLRRRIAETERMHSTLPDLRRLVAQKQDELVHIAAVMSQVNPDWDPKSVKPIRPHAYGLPFKYSECTSLAYDVLRESGRWMTIREVTLKVFEKAGFKLNPALYQRAASNIGRGFHRRLSRGEVEWDQSPYPQRWRVAQRGKVK